MIKSIKFSKIKTYLSSIYDCKALIESKRDSIPYSFENNHRLFKLTKYICNDFLNVEEYFIKNDYSYEMIMDTFIIREMIYLLLECILDNLSEIDTYYSKNIFDILDKPDCGCNILVYKCYQIYSIYKEYFTNTRYFFNCILILIR